MKRYTLVIAVFALLMVLGSIASANFPTIPADTSVTVYLKQGYYQDALVWFFCTDTNDISFASTCQFPFRIPTLSEPLTSAYDPTLNTCGSKMFINVSIQQGPVFTAVPTQDDYSGIWSVVFIKFLPGMARTVTNTKPFDPCKNPTGFPITSGMNKQADLLTSYGASRQWVVVDCPIAAVGPFDNGIWPRNNSCPTKLYRLPQVIGFNKYYKSITLPAWYTYSQERFPGCPPASFYIDKCTVIVPDVANRCLATRIGANFAPALNDIDRCNRQDFDLIDGRIRGVTPPTPFIFGGPLGNLMAVNQFPVLEWAPNGIGVQNTNTAYTPVMDLLVLEGGPNFPFIPPNGVDKKISFANNWTYLQQLLDIRVYCAIPDEVINAPVMSCFRLTRPQGGCQDCSVPQIKGKPVASAKKQIAAKKSI